MNKKIIFVTHNTAIGGGQLLSLNFIRTLRVKFGYNIFIISKGGGALYNEFEKFGEIFEVSKKPVFEERIKLYQKLKEEGYHCAICNTIVVGDIVYELAFANIEVISLIHEQPLNISANDAFLQGSYIALCATKIVFPSNIVFLRDQEILHFDMNKVNIIPQGIYFKNIFKDDKIYARNQLKKKYLLNENSRIIIGVGHGCYIKGFDLFIAVAGDVITNNPNYYFIWVGPYDEYILQTPDCARILKKFNQNIILTGIIPPRDVGLFYSGSDLFFLSSREDSFPSSVLEALDAKLPIVALGESGGVVDMIYPDNGVIIKNGSVEDAGREIILLLNNYERYNRYVKGATKFIENYHSFEDYVFKILNLFSNQPNQNTNIFFQNAYHINKIIKFNSNNACNIHIEQYFSQLINDCFKNSMIQKFFLTITRYVLKIGKCVFK